MLNAQNFPLAGEWGVLPNLSDIETVIVSATNDAFEYKIALLCKENSVRFIQFIDAPYNIHKRSVMSPDILCVVHEENVKEASVSIERIHVTGHPRWEEALSRPITQANPETVIFTSQHISQTSELSDLGYNEQDVWRLLCEAQKLAPDIIKNLIYCPHPEQTDIPAKFCENQRLIDVHENPLEIGGTMISMFSTIMVDGFLYGQKVISVQPGLQKINRCYISKQGFIPLITSFEPRDIIDALISYKGLSANSFKASLSGSLTRFENVCLQM